MKAHKQRLKTSYLGGKFKKIDEFSESASLRLVDGESSNRVSYMGAFLSAIIFGVTAIFLYSKVMVLIKSSDITIMMNTLEGAFTYDDKFTANEGLFIAAALTEYDSNTEVIEEARYGELVIEHYGWGNGDTIGSGSKTLDSHYCSDEELGFTPGPNTSIYPIFESSISVVTTWKKKFKCVDKKDLVIWGDYNSAKAQQFSIKFKMCEGKDYCESDENIK